MINEGLLSGFSRCSLVEILWLRKLSRHLERSDRRRPLGLFLVCTGMGLARRTVQYLLIRSQKLTQRRLDSVKLFPIHDRPVRVEYLKLLGLEFAIGSRHFPQRQSRHPQWLLHSTCTCCILFLDESRLG